MKTRRQRRERCSGGHRGFTLIEVLLAVSLAAFVLAGATAFLVNVSNAWLLRDDRAFLEEHVAGVTTFLRNSFEQSGANAQLSGNANGNGSRPTPPPPPNGGTPEQPLIEVAPQARITGPDRPNNRRTANNNAETPGVAWRPLPGASPQDDPRLSIAFAEGPPILASALPAEQSVRAFLALEPERGLLLRWYGALHEDEPEREDQLFETILSPWVRTLEYLAYDPDRESWETSTEPLRDRNRELIPASFIRITFERDGATAEAHIAIPPVSRGVPLF